jgi:2-haloacid dehalogenase
MIAQMRRNSSLSKLIRPVLVFDVNETLLDIEHLTPLFERVFGDGRTMREWFAQLVLYSQAITLAGAYQPFGALGAAVLRMLGTVKGVTIAEADVAELADRTSALPAHADVAPALDALTAAGFRLATLTNSAPSADGGPLRKAGLERFFEQRSSVDTARRFKPAPETYRVSTDALGIAPDAMCLVACHVWDTLGAQLFGAASALVLRGGNAPLPLESLPPPTIVAADMRAFAEAAIARWPS